MDMARRRVLVIGANGVLGAGIARLLQASGAHVIGTARSADSADRLDPQLDERLLLDVGDADSRAALVQYLLHAGLDGIVNAAGLVAFGSAAQTPDAGADLLMQVNHLGPASTMAGLLPALQEAARAGRTPFVCSITGVVAERAFPGMAAYVASKSAHSAWLSALRLELRRDGVRVVEARPGHTETGLATRPLFGQAPRFPAGHAPEHVARIIVEGLLGDATELSSEAFAARA